MNCKPGDLAIIVNCDFPANIGKLVSVLRPADMNDYHLGPNENDGFLWECETLSDGIIGWDEGDSYSANKAGGLIALTDSYLKPIRDPGDDAADEMVLRTGKPQEVTA
jgi:hypothetical protein